MDWFEQMKQERPSEWEALKRHIDEAKNDPDYAVVGLYADIPDSTCCFSPEYPVSAAELPPTASGRIRCRRAPYSADVS